MLATMKSSSRQPELLPAPPALSGSTMANPHVCVQTEGNHRAILVHGIVFSRYSTQDRAAEAYAMATLFESGYAGQNHIARWFGYSTRTLRRHQRRLQVGGLRLWRDLRPMQKPRGIQAWHVEPGHER